MKKIGLCICYSVKNYGSMLQAYATQQFIEKEGFEYEIIRYNKKHDLKFIFTSCLKLFNNNFRKEVFRQLSYKRCLNKNSELKQNINLRNLKFEEFERNKFKKLSNVCSNYSQLREKGKELDAYLVGSDQLWLPAGLSTNFYNLRFASDDSIKISYATSFGVSKIPWYQKKRTTEYLNRIQFLSVREQRGVEIVKEHTNRDAALVVDPTLLLTKDEWDLYIPKKRIINKNYIFVYFIGNNSQHRTIVKQLQEKTNLEIVVLRHIDEYIPDDEKFGNRGLYDISPGDFINLIRYATYVCTDSFHGSVFSIINKKQFIVFNRFDNSDSNSTNSRIDSLCNILSLNARRFNSDKDIYNQMTNEIDYSSVEEVLVKMRTFSINFLSESLASMENGS